MTTFPSLSYCALVLCAQSSTSPASAAQAPPKVAHPAANHHTCKRHAISIVVGLIAAGLAVLTIVLALRRYDTYHLHKASCSFSVTGNTTVGNYERNDKADTNVSYSFGTNVAISFRGQTATADTLCVISGFQDTTDIDMYDGSIRNKYRVIANSVTSDTGCLAAAFGPDGIPASYNTTVDSSTIPLQITCVLDDRSAVNVLPDLDPAFNAWRREHLQFILIMFIFAFLLLITVVFLLRPLLCIARHAIAPPHKPVHMSSV